MDVNNSYGAKAHETPRGVRSHREVTQSTLSPITVTREEVCFYTDLAINILKDVEIQHIGWSPCDRSKLQMEYARDAEEIRHRVRHEGLAFLTKSLPRLGKAIDTALASSMPLEVTGFELNPVSGLPRFLGRLLQVVFTACRGWNPPDNHGLALTYASMQEWSLDPSFRRAATLDDESIVVDRCGPMADDMYHLRPVWEREDDGPRRQLLARNSSASSGPIGSALALKLLRQVCYSFYKLNLPPDEKDSDRVLTDFIQTDRDLPDEIRVSGHDHSAVLSMARGLISRVLAPVDPLEIFPKHGPGSVATGEKTHQKARFSRFYTRLNAFYPYDRFFFFNSSHLCDRLQELDQMEPSEFGIAKVILVPKDSRGPRLISCEPLEYQWIQQGLMKALVDQIETHPLTKGRVNFADQGVNRGLAYKSSRLGDWNDLVTLDMQEASDRVSLALVRALFPQRWFDALFACRSGATRLPCGRLVPLKKFAPMGSAVCFPVEALIFWALGVSVASTYTNRDIDATVDLLQDHNPGLDRQSHPSLFWVYGDDVICMRQFVAQYRSVLESVGLKLNDSKCCVHGFFRESCGADAYFGVDVTPAKFRRRWSSRYCPESHVSWIAYSNALYDRGFARSASMIADRLNSICVTPYVNTEFANHTGSRLTTDFPAFLRPMTRELQKSLNSRLSKRFNKRLQRMEYRVLVPVPQLVTGDHDGWEEWLRIQSMRNHSPLQGSEVDNLSDPVYLVTEAGQYSLRQRVKLKWRWMPWR